MSNMDRDEFIKQFVDHDLKIFPEYFEHVESGKKNFELKS